MALGYHNFMLDCCHFPSHAQHPLAAIIARPSTTSIVDYTFIFTDVCLFFTYPPGEMTEAWHQNGVYKEGSFRPCFLFLSSIHILELLIRLALYLSISLFSSPLLYSAFLSISALSSPVLTRAR